MTTRDPSSLLERVYTDLDLIGGTLIPVANSPSADDADHWGELGDWLLLADRINAERIFFLGDDPVIVFSSLPSGSDEDAIFDCYRRSWSLARPRCLFLAVGDELRVYSLANPPAGFGADRKAPEPLEIVTRAADVATRLAGFHRERLESGTAFEDSDMAKQSGRADQQLLRDVRTATDALVESGLTARIAHTLIERAILVRYLEDREILTDGYFDDIANRHPGSLDDLVADEPSPNFGRASRFIGFLGEKTLTYDLFDQLVEYFNGDLFLTSSEEREAVAASHLQLLRDLLQGQVGADQQPLFLWAYDFSVIPTNLISNMYEMFYREEVTEGKSNTYYTPPALVELVLGDVLDDDALDLEPTVCDPACGSGIFLVDAFRRIVRHEMRRLGHRLSSQRLRELLLHRISGCDIDESAIRLAAFSLYVAYLSYQTPQDIRQTGALPRLIQGDAPGQDPAPLIVRDVFSARTGDSPPDRAAEGFPWQTHSFDVIVGNPPWTEITGEFTQAEKWASDHGYTIGDRNPSQLFLWRCLELLKNDGVAALLIGAKAMLNTRTTSRAFREQWLRQASIEHVINFRLVRKDFFASAVAPFMLIRFRHAARERNEIVIYETAKPVTTGRRGSSALARLDRQVVPQASLFARDYLWKTYSAGSFRDDSLMARLDVEDRLRELISDHPAGFGFQRANGQTVGRQPSKTLQELRVLSRFDSWGPLREEWFEDTPSSVKYAPNERLFRGRRLLIRWGVSPRFGPHTRLETEPIAFRHTTYAISLDHVTQQQAKVILGTVLSSLGRYWLFMVSGSWGAWRDQVRVDDILNLPLRLTSERQSVLSRIEEGVDSLQHMTPKRRKSGLASTVPVEMTEIDEAVAELFELADAEWDLVTDFWSSQYPNARRRLPPFEEHGGTEADLDLPSADGIWPYLRVFVKAWNRRLGGRGEFGWKIWRDVRTGVIAVVLETRAINGNRPRNPEQVEAENWMSALRRLGVQWDAPKAHSVLRYGMVRAVTDTSVVVVKRDESSLWTASAARQDADATGAQLISVNRR